MRHMAICGQVSCDCRMFSGERKTKRGLASTMPC